MAQAVLTGYHGVLWLSRGVFAAGAVVSALLFRRGRLAVDPHAAPVIAL